MAYAAQFTLVYTDVEKRWMRRFKSDQIKAFGEKLCVGAATTKVNLHKPVSCCKFSPHLNLRCQVPDASTLQLLPTFLASPQPGAFPSSAPLLILAGTVV